MNIKPIHYLYPNYSGIFDLEAFFNELKINYPEVRRQGIYNEGKKPAIFIYRIKTKKRSYHGIIAGVDIKDYLKGHIKKHENTLITQEDNMAKLIAERDGIIKPILLAYNENEHIKNIIIKSFLGKKPKFTIHFGQDEQIHELYKITDVKTIKHIQKLFGTEVKKTYIADGHHRMASISKLLESDKEKKYKHLKYMMCALFDFKELSICPYHRIIQLDSSFDKFAFLTKLRKLVTIKLIKNLRFPSKKHEVIIHLEGLNYSLLWKKAVIDIFKKNTPIVFDIDIFNQTILEQMMQITNLRDDKRIQYIDGMKSLKQISKLVSDGTNLMAVLFYPVKSGEFTKVADKHLILPPKSTWFEPRIRNGILVQEFNSNTYFDAEINS